MPTKPIAADKSTISFGRHIYALGMMLLAIIALVYRDFIAGQAVPKTFPAQTALACASAIFILLAAAALEWRRTATWGAAALTVYYLIVVDLLMNGPLLLRNIAVYGPYEDAAEQLSITVAALILFAATALISPTLAARLTRVGRLAFGLCALVFGGAHFVYMNLTAPLVPKWLPPSQIFWGYATGVCFLLAGLALITGIRARLAAILLTVMLALFGVLVHLPILLADHRNEFNWTEAALNLTIMGAAWVVADSLGPRKS